MSRFSDKQKNKKAPKLSYDVAVCRIFDTVRHHVTGVPFTSNPSNIRRLCDEMKLMGKESGTSILMSHTLGRFFDRYVFKHENTSQRAVAAQLKGWDRFNHLNEIGHEIWNPRIVRLFEQNPQFDYPPERLTRDVLRTASVLISQVLGEPPSFKELVKQMRDGPNGTFAIPFIDADIVTKRLLVDRTEQLDGMIPLRDAADFYSLIGDDFGHNRWLWNAMGYQQWHPTKVTFPNILNDSEPLIVRGNKMASVPKSFKEDRFICSEPTLNLRVQMAVGAAIQRRLKKVGIDLVTQPLVHRNLCKVITKHNLNFATVDWSEASDRLWTDLVRKLLSECPGWLFLLEYSRSHETLFEGTWHKNAMFSTMGNGSTFPLETLLFWAICSSCCLHSNVDDDFVSVFGDDCILPSGAVDTLIQVSQQIGWKINETKSFSTGPFRESCGMDAYLGYNVSGPRPKNFRTGRNIESETSNPFKLVSFCLIYINEYLDVICDSDTGTRRDDVILSEPFVKFFTWLAQYANTKINLVPAHYSNGSGLRITAKFFRLLEKISGSTEAHLRSIFLIPRRVDRPQEKTRVVFSGCGDESRFRHFPIKGRAFLKWVEDNPVDARALGYSIIVDDSTTVTDSWKKPFSFFEISFETRWKTDFLIDRIIFHERIRRTSFSPPSPYSMDILDMERRNGKLVVRGEGHYDLKPRLADWTEYSAPIFLQDEVFLDEVALEKTNLEFGLSLIHI